MLIRRARAGGGARGRFGRRSALAFSAFIAACGGATPIDDGRAGAGSGGSSAAGSGGTSGGTSVGGTSNGGSGGTSSSPASGMEVLHEGESNPSVVALDDRFIYWASEDGVRQAPLEGGAPVTLTPGEYHLRAILPSGEYVYISESSFGVGRVARVPRSGGQAELIAEGVAPQEIAVAGGALYWVDPGISLDTSGGRLVAVWPVSARGKVQ